MNSVSSNTTHLFEKWLKVEVSTIGKHRLWLLEERDGSRPSALAELREIMKSHYVDPKITASRLASLGAPKTAELLLEHLPRGKRARSGDLGEILATEVAEQNLEYEVPIRRLRWKDGRDMALRGDDIVGLAREEGKLRLLKGEAKSRAKLSAAVLEEAGSHLDYDWGRPTRHSVLFVAERLREQGHDGLAEDLEQAVLNSFRGIPVVHLLFVLSGNPAESLLSDHLSVASKKKRLRHAAGFRIQDHGGFIEHLFGDF